LPQVAVVAQVLVLQHMQPIVQHTQTVPLFTELPAALVWKVVMVEVVVDYMVEQAVVVPQTDRA
jgi:hypothetical protein